jgi:hypothetical protein
MANEHRAWPRQGADFWRAHHEAWTRSDLNQRQDTAQGFRELACAVQSRAAAS